MSKLIMTLLALTALAACGKGPAQAADAAAATVQENAPNSWIIDKDDSSIVFHGTQEGEAFEGLFPKFDATIILDPDDLENASIRAVIDMSRIEAGDDDRNSSLPGRDWFHVRKFPEATFTSNLITRNPEGVYEAVGTLQIKDVQQDITLPFTLTITDEIARATAELALIRTDYNVGQGAFSKGTWVGLDVKVEIQILARRAEQI